uniref:Putative salivary lipocalin n=1 Tax=Ixodes ricinus TaxID=34613 RepID=A0A0K8R644_IXORI
MRKYYIKPHLIFHVYRVTRHRYSNMILLVLLAVCSFAYCDAAPQGVTSRSPRNKDAWKLFLQPQKFYLLYRSEKNDTKLGGDRK